MNVVLGDDRMLARYLAALVFATGMVVGASRGVAQEAKPADPAAKPKLNFQDHVQLVFREHCNTCHSADQAKGGLALDTFAATMRGGASGEVVFPGDLESSRLWALVAHLETPKMPPEQDKLPEAKLNLIKQWILDGALENAGSKAKTVKKPSLELKVTAGSAKPEGPPPMPESLPRDPYVVAPRPGAVTAIAASPWAPLVAVGGQKQVMLYHTDTGELLGFLPFPEGIPHVLKFSRSGSVLLVGGGRNGASGKVVLYEVKTGQRLAEIGDELDTVLAADVNDDLTIVALGGPRRLVKMFYVNDGSEVCPPLKKHTDWVYSIEFSPDGVLLASSDRSGGLVVWEGDTGREFHNLVGHKSGVTDVSWRADSNVLASSSEDGTIKLWEMDNGREIRSFSGAEGQGVQAVEFARDGRLVSVGRSKKAYLWSKEGQLVRAYAGFVDITMDVAISSDAKRLIAGDLQGGVRLFDAESDKLVADSNSNPPTLDGLIALETANVTRLTQEFTSAEAAHKEATTRLEQMRKTIDAAPAAAEAIKQRDAAKAQADKLATEASAKVKQTAEAVQKTRAAAQKARDESAAASKLATDKATAAKTLAADAKADKAAVAKAQKEAADALQASQAKATAAKQAADAESAAATAANQAATAMNAAAKAQTEAVAALEAARKQATAAKQAADNATKEKPAIEKLFNDRAQAVKAAKDALEQARVRVERAKGYKAASTKPASAQPGTVQASAK